LRPRSRSFDPGALAKPTRVRKQTRVEAVERSSGLPHPDREIVERG
jgi:hypothetical protein